MSFSQSIKKLQKTYPDQLEHGTAVSYLLDHGLAESTVEAEALLKHFIDKKVLVVKKNESGDDTTQYNWGSLDALDDNDTKQTEFTSSTSEDSDDSPHNASNSDIKASDTDSKADSETSEKEAASTKKSKKGDDGKKNKSKKKTKADKDDIDRLSPNEVEQAIQTLVVELSDLAPEVRQKLNTSAFSELITTLLEDAKAASDTPPSPEPEIRKSSNPKSLNRINKEAETNMATFSSQLARMRSQTDIVKKRKVLAALREMKKNLHNAIADPKKNAKIQFLEGEEVEWNIEEVSATGLQGSFTGRIAMTNYRLMYIDANGAVLDSIPLATIWSASKIDKKKKEKDGTKKPKPNDKPKDTTRSYKKLELILKDQRVFYLFFKRDAIDELLERLKAFTAAMPKSLFCWKHTVKHSFNGWELYSPLKEFQRMGVPNLQWRITEINKNWALSDTYPQVLAVPATVDDELLRAASAFRSRNRFPALAYRHINGATLTRCSQPAVGMSRKRSKEDEKLLLEISHTNPQTDMLPILDARPKANAVANFAMGYGFEVISHYPNCTIAFCDIENIHVMRNSLFKLRDLLYSADDGKWLQNLDATGWLTHQQLILASVVKTVDLVHNQSTSVLIHCTDGWDRTSQLISLASLLLDPYYRTIKGFMVLIEKDWLSFGHRFGMRHAIDGTDSSDRAPIFHQFIEVTWQLLQQFPLHFEFNEKLLIVLLDELYACRFGTFLYDCEKERVEAEVHLKTPSLWGHIMDNVHNFTNPLYQPVEGVLFASAASRLIRFWESYYFRHHKEFFSRSWTNWDFVGSGATRLPADKVSSCVNTASSSTASAAAVATAGTSASAPSEAKKKSNKPTKTKDDSATPVNGVARLRSMTTSSYRTNGDKRVNLSKTKPTE